MGIDPFRPVPAIACLAALVFVIVELGSPPSALPSRMETTLPASGAPAHSAAGAGETLAIVGLGLAVIGMWAMLAVAQAARRRLRAGQRATGSAARSPRTGMSADGSV